MPLLGLISDIHGDPTALELAWAHLTVMGADPIICAGDLVGYGPFPDRVVAFLADHKVASVRGNHDRWALEREPFEPDSFGGGIPSEDTLIALKGLDSSLVFEAGGKIVVVVHGSPRGDMEFITPKTHPPHVLDGLLTTLDADILVHGHTHRPMSYRSRLGLVVNPGSVISIPVVETSRTFAAIDLDTLTARVFDVESGDEVQVRPWPGIDDSDDPEPVDPRFF